MAEIGEARKSRGQAQAGYALAVFGGTKPKASESMV